MDGVEGSLTESLEKKFIVKKVAKRKLQKKKKLKNNEFNGLFC